MQGIKQIQGSYEPRVQLDNGNVVGLVDYLKTLRAEIAGQTTLALHTQYAPVPSYIFTLSGEAWFSTNPGNGGIRSLYVPTLEELGLDTASYDLEAMAVVEAADPNATSDPLDIRVLDLSDNSVVTGSEGTGNLSGSSLDAAIKTEYFTITGGKSYFVDARKRNVNETFLASLGRYRLYIRAVAK
ncbi:hypothetical protein [Phaeodactylibacter xiamenensis]|uniref:hypothetical protein n=1 Tax=Phaeodactylibacter xiamenensis TaxID=1524460 RepID=UPI0024A865C9|nr:hypothetical protein [Phaeodactylibacter xiamenensis]